MVIRTVNYLLVPLLAFASIFVYIITRSLRGFAKHGGKMRGKNFIRLSFFTAPNEVFFQVHSQLCIWVWGQREASTENFFCWFSPNSVHNTALSTEEAVECTDSFIDCPFCSDMPAPLKWWLAGVSVYTWLLWDSDKLVDSWAMMASEVTCSPSVPQGHLCSVSVGCIWIPYVTKTDVLTPPPNGHGRHHALGNFRACLWDKQQQGQLIVDVVKHQSCSLERWTLAINESH